MSLPADQLVYRNLAVLIGTATDNTFISLKLQTNNQTPNPGRVLNFALVEGDGDIPIACFSGAVDARRISQWLAGKIAVLVGWNAKNLTQIAVMTLSALTDGSAQLEVNLVNNSNGISVDKTWPRKYLVQTPDAFEVNAL